jgi:DNA-binding NtrC family response regulator
VEIHVPPLRERQEDIPLLAQFFTEQFAKKYNRAVPVIDSKAMDKLQSYTWPGNIRELRHTIERTIIMNESDRFQEHDFVLSATEPADEKLISGNYNLEDNEKLLIRKTLSMHHGNISKAAKTLGLTRTSLYRRMEKYGL